MGGLLLQNLRYSLRHLRTAPGFSAVVIITLALGIGANTAVFSLFHQLLLQPLPVPEPERLVNFGAPGPKWGSTTCSIAGDCEQVFSYPLFRDLEKLSLPPLAGIAAHRDFSANIAFDGRTVNEEALLVSGDYFSVLGLTPAAGRLIDQRDDQIVGDGPVAVLSHAWWQREFGGDLQVLNRTLIINGQSLTIIGVAPAGFDGTTIGVRPRVFVPVTLRWLMQPGIRNDADDRKSYWLYLFGRMNDGITPDAVRAAINVPYRAIINDIETPQQEGMSEATMARFRAREITVEPGARGQSFVPDEARVPLTMLLAVTLLVLLIAAANIANLLLARAASRAGDMAVRLALGAGRRRLMIEQMTEAGLLAAAGGLAGVLTAGGVLRAMIALLPADILTGVGIDTRLQPSILLFAGGVTLGALLLFGLYPAFHTTGPTLGSVLKGQGGRAGGGRSAARLRTTLVTAQIALATGLLALAGLFIQSLLNVSRTDLGLRADRITMFSVSPELNGYSPEQSAQLFARLEEALAAEPGTATVTSSMVPLLANSSSGSSVSVEGFEKTPDTDDNSRSNQIGPGFFNTLGIPLLAGREFAPADALDRPKVAIVNQAFVKKFNLGGNPVGKRMAVGGEESLGIEIVGWVGDAKYNNVRDEIPPQYFTPYRQNETLGFLTFYVRSELAAEQVYGSIRRIVSRFDPQLPVENLKTLPQQVRDNVFLDRFVSVLAGSFAALATLLAALGLYGVLSYTLTDRTREIGLRSALGAGAGRLQRMVLGQVGVMALIGGMIGLAIALGAGRAAQTLLFEMSAVNAKVITITLLLLALVALAAGWLPARRAARVQPMEALRYE